MEDFKMVVGFGGIYLLLVGMLYGVKYYKY